MSKILSLSNLGSDYGSYFLDRGLCDLVGAHNVRQWPYKHSHNGGKDHYPERCWHQEGSAPGRPGDVIHVVTTQTPVPRGKYLSPGRVLPGTSKMGYVRSFRGCELWAHKALWRGWQPDRLPGAYIPASGPVHFMAPLGIPEASDDEILQMLRDGAFALIVLNGARWHDSAALHELRATIPNLPPVAFCDHEDYPQHRWDFTDALSPNIYFKRTLLTTGHPYAFILGNRPQVRVRPMPFSSMWDVPWVPWSERTYDVCCLVGNTHVSRQRLLEATRGIVERMGARGRFSLGHLPYSEYLHVLAHGKLVVDQQGNGSDTVRFWEGLASGAAVISDHHLVHPSPALDPETHFIQYPNDVSPKSDQQDFVWFADRLRAALTDDSGTERIARAGYDAVRAHHQCIHRARHVIAEMRAAGHGLEGLP